MNKITRQEDENEMNIYGLHSTIKAIDGCKDAKGLNLYQFQNDSWLYEANDLIFHLGRKQAYAYHFIPFLFSFCLLDIVFVNLMLRNRKNIYV